MCLDWMEYCLWYADFPPYEKITYNCNDPQDREDYTNTYETGIGSKLSTCIKEHFLFTIIEIIFPEKAKKTLLLIGRVAGRP